MKEAIAYAPGIRVLKQDIFETLIAFIISANNNLKRIQASMFALSRLYGEKLSIRASLRQALDKAEYLTLQEYAYSFPSPEKLASMSADELRQNASVGYRDVFIVRASQQVVEDISLEHLESLKTKELEQALQQFAGVGPKVAACIALYAFGRGESFPVDVWIKRAMEQLYLGRSASKKEILEEAHKRFGNYAGFAQQYLFYYAKDRL
ncbi:MAG: hypothetical protein Q4E22_00430 [Coriobacteriia bacterium]|nr:hypothetical protein [Coriobacteriia bacterium]